MSIVGGSSGIPILVPRDLERPLKNSTQKIQNTLTSGSEYIWKCRSAGVLPRGSLDCLLTKETRD